MLSFRLFTGDILYDGPLIQDAYHSNPEHYLASMTRLAALGPAPSTAATSRASTARGIGS